MRAPASSTRRIHSSRTRLWGRCLLASIPTNSLDGDNSESGKVEKLKSGKVSVKYGVVIATFALAAIATPALAQLPAAGVVAFVRARVIDGSGGAPIEQATIVVTNGRITAIGPSASVMPPAGATAINVAGKTIIPGLINSHAHIDPDISINPGPYRDEMVRRLKTYAIYGVTSIMTLGFETYDEPEGFYLRDTQRLGIRSEE